jgi:hypothetical protein
MHAVFNSSLTGTASARFIYWVSENSMKKNHIWKNIYYTYEMISQFSSTKLKDFLTLSITFQCERH